MRPRLRQGFTLIEIMLVLALVSLIYSLITYCVVQVARVTRTASVAAIRKRDLLKASERLRWQLRGLWLDPDGGVAGGNTTVNATTTNTTNTTIDPRLSQRLPGIVGTPGASIYGRTDTEGQDYILLITTAPVQSRVITETGFRVLTAEGHTDLQYRQFPVRSIGGFHDLPDVQTGPWSPLLRDVAKFTLDYTTDGVTWQRQYDDVVMPRLIHVHLETLAGEVLDYQVTPGTGAGRW